MKTFRSVVRSRLAIAITAVIVTATLVAGGLAGALPGTKSVFNNDIDNGAVDSRTIKNNNVKSKDIKNGTIKSKDIRDGTITTADLAPDVLTTGPAGPAGTDGTDGTDAGPDCSLMLLRNVIGCVDDTVGATKDVGGGPYDVAFDGTHIWVANDGDDTVSKIVP